MEITFPIGWISIFGMTELSLLALMRATGLYRKEGFLSHGIHGNKKLLPGPTKIFQNASDKIKETASPPAALPL